MPIEPYLFFNGLCEEALALYQRAFGAQIETMHRFRESPAPMPEGSLPPGWEDKVMHASLLIGGSRIMASDGRGAEPPQFRGFALSVVIEPEEKARAAFDALAEGGHVDMPLAPTFYSPYFGMVRDRFGVQWMITGPYQQG
ncbi:MAG: VOC family protein [Bryobacteraceae bacterium]|nr:VOC family protein [Bryobacteraceae bacterium]